MIRRTLPSCIPVRAATSANGSPCRLSLRISRWFGEHCVQHLFPEPFPCALRSAGARATPAGHAGQCPLAGARVPGRDGDGDGGRSAGSAPRARGRPAIARGWRSASPPRGTRRARRPRPIARCPWSRAWTAARRSVAVAPPSAGRARTPGRHAPRPRRHRRSAARSTGPDGRRSRHSHGPGAR